MKDLLLLFTCEPLHPLAFHSKLFLILLLEIRFVNQHHDKFTFLKLGSWVFYLLCYKASGDFYNWMSTKLQAKGQSAAI